MEIDAGTQSINDEMLREMIHSRLDENMMAWEYAELDPVVATVIGLVYLVLIILMVVSMWKIYTKAGKPGWASIIPIYNIVVFLEIVKKPIWWIFLMFIPFVNMILGVYLAHRLSRSFGRDIGTTLGLLFLSIIFYPILAFGSATYKELQD